MKPRRVRLTATASQHVEAARTWWLANREHRDVFATELESAIQVAALLPGAGTPYSDARTAGLRRLYVRKVACHLYYTFDDDEVIVRALWGARRAGGPDL